MHQSKRRGGDVASLGERHTHDTARNENTHAAAHNTATEAPVAVVYDAPHDAANVAVVAIASTVLCDGYQ